MATNYGPYGIGGYNEDSNGDVWYPHWHIEVKDNSWNPPSWYYGSLNKVDLKAELLRISAENPLVDVWLISTISTRMVARAGKIVKEFLYGNIWLVGPDDEEAAKMFDDLVCCDHHIYGERFR